MKKQTKIWKTRDGNKIRICGMEDSHLINTIKMLQRRAEVLRIKTEASFSVILLQMGIWPHTTMTSNLMKF